MPTTVLYRKSSNEVLKISPGGQSFTGFDSTYFGVLTNPDFPDGSSPVREIMSDGSLGELRQVGHAKIAEPSTGVNGTVRLATQLELDDFASLQSEDEGKQDAKRAIDLLNSHPQFRKLMIAYSDTLKEEFNILRGWITNYKSEVSVATSLADLKSRIATLPDLPDRNLDQLRTAIQNRISKDD